MTVGIENGGEMKGKCDNREKEEREERKTGVNAIKGKKNFAQKTAEK